MKFLWLSLKNFKSYGNTDTKLEFENEGIRLFVAKNGAGKSNFFSALIWCLYGKTEMSVDNVVNRYNKKNCKVGVCFSINNVEYTVYRYRKHETHSNNIYIFRGEENISLKISSDTQQLIQDIIQIPYQAMISSIMFSSETYVSFLRSKPGDRLKIVESILSLKEVNEYADEAKKKLKENSERVSKLETGIDKINSIQKNIADNISTYKENAKKTLLSFKQEKKEKEEEIEILEQNFEELKKVDTKKELQKIKDKEEAERHNNQINIQIKNFSNTKTEDYDSEYSKLFIKLEEFKRVDVEKELKTIKENLETKRNNENCKTNIESLKRAIQAIDYENEIELLNIEIIKIKKDLTNIALSVCPLCGQHTDAKLNYEIKEKKENSLKEIENKVLLLRAKELEQNLKNSKLEKEIVTFELSIKKEKLVEYTEEVLTGIKTSIEEIQKKIDANLVKKEEQEKNLKKYEEHLSLLNSSLMKIPEISSYSKEILENVDEIKEKINLLKNDIKNIGEKVKSAFSKEYIEELTGKIEKLNVEKEKLEANHKEEFEENRYLSVLTDIFSNKDGGFKKYFINKIVSIFNSNINFYLPLFFELPIEINFNRDLVETINYDGFEVEFNGFSSGQKTRIETAIAFSLFALAKTFFSSNINIMVFDEILDQNLDEEGVNAVIEIITNIAKNAGIFIISHRDSYKERFTKQINVRMNDGFSELSA